jgi:hypothetical protein
MFTPVFIFVAGIAFLIHSGNKRAALAAQRKNEFHNCIDNPGRHL